MNCFAIYAIVFVVVLISVYFLSAAAKRGDRQMRSAMRELTKNEPDRHMVDY